jgi:hypothetical protein
VPAVGDGARREAAEQIVQLVDALDRSGRVVDPGRQRVLRDVDEQAEPEPDVVGDGAFGIEPDEADDVVVFVAVALQVDHR